MIQDSSSVVGDARGSMAGSKVAGRRGGQAPSLAVPEVAGRGGVVSWQACLALAVA